MCMQKRKDDETTWTFNLNLILNLPSKKLIQQTACFKNNAKLQRERLRMNLLGLPFAHLSFCFNTKKASFIVMELCQFTLVVLSLCFKLKPDFPNFMAYLLQFKN